MLIEKQPKIDANVVNIRKIVDLTIEQAFDRINTSEIDKLTSEICAYKGIENPEYSMLAPRIEISNLHKNNKMNNKIN